MSSKDDLDMVEVDGDLELLNRRPFRHLLGQFLGIKPTKAALQRFANRSPDRWASAVATLAALVGYEKGTNIQVNVYNVHGLSDAELYAEARKRGVPIDVTEVEVIPARSMLALPAPSTQEGS